MNTTVCRGTSHQANTTDHILQNQLQLFLVWTEMEEHHRDTHPWNTPCSFTSFFLSPQFFLKNHHRSSSGNLGYILIIYVEVAWDLRSFRVGSFQECMLFHEMLHSEISTVLWQMKRHLSAAVVGMQTIFIHNITGKASKEYKQIGGFSSSCTFWKDQQYSCSF